MPAKRSIILVAAICLLVFASAATAETPLPAALQGVITVLDNALVTKSQASPPFLEVVSKDSQKKVYEFFKADLVAKAWKVAGDHPNMNKTYHIQLKKGGKTLTIGIGSM